MARWGRLRPGLQKQGTGTGAVATVSERTPPLAPVDYATDAEQDPSATRPVARREAAHLETLPAMLGERYRVLEVIGHGGMATVYLADDTVLHRKVAVKVFHQHTQDAVQLRLQEAEAKVVASLNHYALITLFDVGVDTRDLRQPRIFLVMEHIDGTDLKQRLADDGALDFMQVCWLGFDLAEALHQVHRAGFLHRDVKPGNVLLFPEEPERRLRGKLTDFGIASIIGTTESDEITTGTVAYLSPEQVEGLDATTASDVYALGLVLLEAMTGQVAFPGSVDQSAMARLDRDPEIPGRIPGQIAEVIRGMTARRPEHRISLRDAASGLQTYLIDELVRVRVLDPALIAPDETQRIAALRRYDVLDTPPDDTYDAITRLASRMLQVPIALVTLIDMDRVWFKSRHGWDEQQVERNVSFCATTDPGSGEPWSIPDAQQDDRTRLNPLVTGGPEVRAYAGAPLITHDGHTLGALCVFDKQARPFTTIELENLRDLASLVMHEMELRLATRRAIFER